MVCGEVRTAQIMRTEVKIMAIINGNVLLRINFRGMATKGMDDADILRALSIFPDKFPKEAEMPVCAIAYCEQFDSADELADAVMSYMTENSSERRSCCVTTEEVMDRFFVLYEEVMDAYGVIRDRAMECGGYSVRYTGDEIIVTKSL